MPPLFPRLTPSPLASGTQPQVRQQAYHSLGTYSFQLLEQIEAVGPLVDYIELLQRETRPTNRPAVEALVAAALAHEHAM